MRAFVIRGPRDAAVEDVPAPIAGPGQAVVDVHRVGVCGTDMELFAGSMPYLLSGATTYPLRPGHEWSGVVAGIGDGVDPAWTGAMVTGDTMLGCGHCPRCLAGRHHVCAQRHEVGIRDGWPGALAEQVLMPVIALRRLPAGLSSAAGALVEPGGCALRAVQASGVGPGQRLCVWGPGTLGLLATQFAVARGAVVDVVGVEAGALALARELGADRTLLAGEAAAAGPQRYDAVIDTSNSPDVPGHALRQVVPAGRIVLVGIADTPSLIDTRLAVLGDITVVGILAASLGLDDTIKLYASGAVRTDPLIAATVGLADVAGVLAGQRPHAEPPAVAAAPKVQVDPRR